MPFLSLPGPWAQGQPPRIDLTDHSSSCFVGYASSTDRFLPCELPIQGLLLGIPPMARIVFNVHFVGHSVLVWGGATRPFPRGEQRRPHRLGALSAGCHFCPRFLSSETTLPDVYEGSGLGLRSRILRSLQVHIEIAMSYGIRHCQAPMGNSPGPPPKANRGSSPKGGI